VIAQAQQAGGTACFIDTEHAWTWPGPLPWASTWNGWWSAGLSMASRPCRSPRC
jgi:hypothetical protein